MSPENKQTIEEPCGKQCVVDFKYKRYHTCSDHGREEWEAIRSLCIVGEEKS